MQELLVAYDVEVAIAQLPAGLDPCDLLVQPGGVEVFTEALAGAQDALDFRLDRMLAKHPTPNIETTRRILDDTLSTLAIADVARSVQTQVKRELIVTRLSHRLGLRQETVWARLSELQAERRIKEKQAAVLGPRVQTSAARVSKPADEPPADGPAPRGKAGAAVAAEKQLLQLVLADPGLVPKAAAALAPEELTHSGLRRMLAELYATHAAGAVPDIDALRERLADRPDLFESAQKLQFVGQQMQDREQWLGRILRRFAELNAEAEQRAVKEKLASATDDEAVELLRRLQQSQENKRKNAG